MEEDPDPLDKLAESVADGDSIDWSRLEGLPPDDPRRRFLQHLRIIADVAEQHRSASDDPLAVTKAVPAFDPDGHLGVASVGYTGAQAVVGRWGHLVLRRKIGEGAFGEVFHAHDTWLDHPVALKLLKPDITESDFSSRILHEARRLARVRHPNVVSVHGADKHDGRVGFWMDLIEGDTLSALVANGRLSAGEASHIGQEVCLALAAVHQASMVHRDVKAQNVMRAADGGRIILMDFGAGEFMGRPTAGRIRGTPLYLAPEIFKGGAATVSTDIYAVGVLLYHLVTGSYPVTGSSLDSLADAHAKGERRRLRDERPDLPASFVTIVEQAIDADPKGRFTTAGDFYAALTGEEKAREHKGDTSIVKRLYQAVVVVVGTLAATEALGLLASRAFERLLHVDPVFAAGAQDYFRVGVLALFPFVIVWTAFGAVVALLVGLRALIWPHMGLIRRRWSSLSERLDPATLAGLVVCLGVAGLAALTLSFYGVYYALTALGLDQRPDLLDLSILGPAGRPVHRTHAFWSAILSFTLGVAAWLWFPRLEKRVSDPSRVRTLKWAALIVAFLVVAVEAVPRPIIWDLREMVLFEDQPAFVIGTSNEELLLYKPAPGERTSLRVRKDAAGLRRNVASRALFDSVPPVN
jgi:serine/threonine-protein kinase